MGSKMALPKRSARTFWTVSLPSSGRCGRSGPLRTRACNAASRTRALARSRPKGFSTTIRANVPPVAGEVAAVLGEGVRHVAEHRRDRGQVVDAVAARAELGVGFGQHLLQLVEGRLLGVLARHVPEPADGLLPLGTGVRGGVEGRLAELLVAPLGAGHAHDGEALGERPMLGQRGDGRQELARRQVTGCAEHHQRERRRRLHRIQRVGDLLDGLVVVDVDALDHRGGVGCHEDCLSVSGPALPAAGSVTTACPPNWLRRAAVSRLE